MTDIDAIVAGLSKAQRDGLLLAGWHGSGESQFAVAEGLAGLPANLAHMFTLRWDRLTPLGLAVRARLMEQANAG